MRMFLSLILVVVAQAGLAQQVNPLSVETCFAEAGPGESAPLCLGRAAEACQQAGDDTTVGIVSCIQAETAVWDRLLNDVYRSTRDALAAQDPALKTVLLEAQRAWIAYRDAECRLELARWSDASLRGIVVANCMMLETAERAIELRDKKEY